MEIAGFWDGADRWTLCFSPPSAGKWEYRTSSEDPALNGITGTLEVMGWTAEEKTANPTRRGFLKVNDQGPRKGRYFIHADGTPFLWIGDTWWNRTKSDLTFDSFRRVVISGRRILPNHRQAPIPCPWTSVSIPIPSSTRVPGQSVFSPPICTRSNGGT